MQVRLAHAPTRVFNKGLALNLGAALMSSKILMLLDADVVLADDFLDSALRWSQRGAYVTIDRVRESAASGRRASASAIREMAQHLELCTEDGARAFVELSRFRRADGSRSGPGLVVVSRADFVAVGGMNSDLVGWGWEDIDLLVRLQLVRSLKPVSLGSAIHLSHGDDVRDLRRANRYTSEHKNRAASFVRYASGVFQGTLARDVSRTLRRCQVYLVEPRS